MKSLRVSFLIVFFVFVLLSMAQSTIVDCIACNRQSWIQSIWGKEGKSINSNDFLFYYTGHYGKSWSLITSDSSGIYLYNGTTRDNIPIADNGSFDTLSFLKNNIGSITWGFDSLANAAQLLMPLKSNCYNPVYNELYRVKDNKVVFSLNCADYFCGPDSARFNSNLVKLLYLMYWLAAPSNRPYLPVPCDTLLPK